MKNLVNIISTILLALILYVAFFVDFGPKSEVTTPEVKQSRAPDRMIKEGDCYRQFTSLGTVLVCGQHVRI